MSSCMQCDVNDTGDPDWNESLRSMEDTGCCITFCLWYLWLAHLKSLAPAGATSAWQGYPKSANSNKMSICIIHQLANFTVSAGGTGSCKVFTDPPARCPMLTGDTCGSQLMGWFVFANCNRAQGRVSLRILVWSQTKNTRALAKHRGAQLNTTD